MISATPVPFIFNLISSGLTKDVIGFLNVEPSIEYVGIDDHKPLIIDGEEIFLEQDELKASSAIPYTNDKVFALYDDAVSRRPNTKGVLLLDISSPYVNIAGSARQKATGVQRKMLDDHGVGKL